MKLFIYCAGGFGREVHELASKINRMESKWDEIFFIDDGLSNKEVYGTKVFTFNEVIQQFNLQEIQAVIANGEPLIRRKLYEKLKENNIRLVTLIDSTAVVSDTAKIGEGVVISYYCVISSMAVVGDNSTLNALGIIGHDVSVGDNCVISSNTCISGASQLGNECFVGLGAQVKQGTKIGKEVIVGMGSIVYNDIQDNVIVLGNPARPMKRNDDKKVFK